MLKTAQQRIILSTLLLFFTGLADYVVSFEISTAVFYMIPIIVFSYQHTLRLGYSVLFGILAWSVWMEMDYLTHAYSEQRYLIINWFFRAALFVGTAIVANRFFREKTQRKIISEQKAALEKTNLELNQLLGVAAHDIRNPVGSIQTMAELLLEEKAITQEIKELVGMIQTSAKNSLQILNDTLNISQIESGTIRLNITTHDYIQFIRECIVVTSHLAIRKNQTIHLASSIESIQTAFDKSRISQAVSNLVTNAIKYSESGTEIIVRVSFSDNTKTCLLTEVIDKGLGIDKKYHEILFNPFSTTSNKPTGNESKSGLGLAIVKKVVELHEGEVGFRSEKGLGSDFYFTLPVK